jgi:ribonuclease HI
MRWAVHSALQCAKAGIPSLTLFILPAWDESSCTSYERWLRECPGTVKEIMRIPKKMFKFRKPTSWLDADTYAGNPKWDVKIIMVANELGQKAYCKLQTYKQIYDFEDDMSTALQEICPDQAVAVHTTPPEKGGGLPMHPSEKFMDDAATNQQLQSAGADHTGMLCPKGLRPHNARRDTPYNMGYISAHTDEYNHARPLNELTAEMKRMHQLAKSIYHEASALAHDWKSMAYTDGSAKTTTTDDKETTFTGAAVFIPDTTGHGLPGTTIRINPGQEGVTHTNNRAEGVALLKCIQMLPETDKTAICTDSLVNMLLIRMAVNRPQALRYNLHNKLMEEVVKALDKRDTPLDIYKVASHIGVIGNEMADTGARLAASGKYDLTITDGADPYREVYYPRAQIPVPTQTQAQAAAEGEAQPPEEQPKTRETTPANLGKALKRLSHAVHRLGKANLDTIYGQAWARVVSKTDGQTSNLFVNNTSITSREKKLTRQYRYGGLPTQTLLFRYGYATSSECLLCGAEHDGNHHAISGCKAMSRPVTERHNGAARIIAKAIIRGRQGAKVIMADIGNKEKLAAAGVTGRVQAVIPYKLWPTKYSKKDRQAAQLKYKPDILIDEGRAGGAGTKGRRLTLVELKYCRDTDPEYRLQQAHNQHAELIGILKEAGHETQLVTILLGVGGTIYKTTKEAIHKLGATSASKTTSDLHYYSVKWVNTMWNIRQFNVRMKKAGQRTPGLLKSGEVQDRGHASQPPEWGTAPQNDKGITTTGDNMNNHQWRITNGRMEYPQQTNHPQTSKQMDWNRDPSQPNPMKRKRQRAWGPNKENIWTKRKLAQMAGNATMDTQVGASKRPKPPTQMAGKKRKQRGGDHTDSGRHAKIRKDTTNS